MRPPSLPPLGAPRTGPARVIDPAPATLPGMTEVQDFGSNPGGLRMFVRAPARLSKSAPLVVILHGCGQTASGYDHGAGWSELGERLGFVVLAPEQQNANNMAGCFNWFQPGDVARDCGEAASIRQMIARTVADYRLDAKRVYITGLSAGGAMTGAMLASYPEIFAGGAIIAGLPYGAASNVPEALNAMRRAPERAPGAWGQAVRKASSHAGRWPLLSVWHGDADTTVHISNAQAVVDQWADLHGLTMDQSEVEQIGDHVRRRWRRADRAVVLEFYSLADIAHGTPIHTGVTGGGNAGPFFIEAGLSSTLQIADFWGLTSATSQPVAEMAVVENFRHETRPVHQAAVEVTLSRSESPKQADHVDGVRGVILKALKAAGLVKP